MNNINPLNSDLNYPNKTNNTTNKYIKTAKLYHKADENSPTLLRE